MSNRFENKVVIITGAGSGIGKATALRVAREGGTVVVANRSDAGASTVEEIKAFGGEGIFVRSDVSVEDDCKNVVEQAMATYGKIDCLYNNSAITGNNADITEYDPALFNKVIQTNLNGQFYMMRYALPHMKSGSSILNCSSLHGIFIGMAQDAAYSASKHAIIGMTKSVAKEVGHRNIRVNAICPGPIPTPTMNRYEKLLFEDVELLQSLIASGTALGRYGTPEEVAAFACFLLSDEASFITGTAHVIDGGYSATK